jgi:hypothetical protein
MNCPEGEDPSDSVETESLRGVPQSLEFYKFRYCCRLNLSWTCCSAPAAVDTHGSSPAEPPLDAGISGYKEASITTLLRHLPRRFPDAPASILLIWHMSCCKSSLPGKVRQLLGAWPGLAGASRPGQVRAIGVTT